MATVQGEEQEQASEDKVVLVESINQSEEEQAISSQLISRIGQAERITWKDDFSSYQGAQFIVLLETAAPFLASLSENDFTSLKKLIETAGSILWVTKGDDPRLDMVLGLTRTLRSEMPTLKFRVLQITADNIFDASTFAGHIWSVGKAPVGSDNEYKLHQDVLNIARIIEDQDMNAMIAGQSQTPEPKMMAIKDAHAELMLDIGVPGMLDTLRFIEDTTADKQLGADEVEMKVKATGLK